MLVITISVTTQVTKELSISAHKNVLYYLRLTITEEHFKNLTLIIIGNDIL